MKKEINQLLNCKHGSFRINNFSVLMRAQENPFGEKIDVLLLSFDILNGVSFSECNAIINSRDFDGIIHECAELTKQYFEYVADKTAKELVSGYCRYGLCIDD